MRRAETLRAAGVGRRPSVVNGPEQPREALSQSNGGVVRGRDPRLSKSGDWAARRLGMVLEQLAKLDSWLRHDGRAQLRSYDRPLLAPGFRRLAREATSVAELSDELAQELER